MQFTVITLELETKKCHAEFLDANWYADAIKQSAYYGEAGYHIVTAIFGHHFDMAQLDSDGGSNLRPVGCVTLTYEVTVADYGTADAKAAIERAISDHPGVYKQQERPATQEETERLERQYEI